MNPHLLFWIPAILRFSLIFAGAGIVAYFYGPMLGIGFAFITVCVLLLAQLHGRDIVPVPTAQFALNYAIPLYPVSRVPAALNGFGLWNVLVLVLMLAAYGWPIAQFIATPSPGAVLHHVDRAG